MFFLCEIRLWLLEYFGLIWLGVMRRLRTLFAVLGRLLLGTIFLFSILFYWFFCLLFYTFFFLLWLFLGILAFFIVILFCFGSGGRLQSVKNPFFVILLCAPWDFFDHLLVIGWQWGRYLVNWILSELNNLLEVLSISLRERSRISLQLCQCWLDWVSFDFHSLSSRSK